MLERHAAVQPRGSFAARSPSAFPAVANKGFSSSYSIKPDFGVPEDDIQALPIYRFQPSNTGSSAFPTCPEPILFEDQVSSSMDEPVGVNNYGFSIPPPIPDYDEAVPVPYIQREIDDSMVPLDVHADTYEEPSVRRMLGLDRVSAPEVSYSHSLHQPHDSSERSTSESGITGMFRSVSRAFSRLSEKSTHSTQSSHSTHSSTSTFPPVPSFPQSDGPSFPVVVPPTPPPGYHNHPFDTVSSSSSSSSSYSSHCCCSETAAESQWSEPSLKPQCAAPPCQYSQGIVGCVSVWMTSSL